MLMWRLFPPLPMRCFLGVIVLGVVILSFTGSAVAAPCGTPTDGLDTSDATFRNNPADDCAGVFPGNYNEQIVPLSIPDFDAFGTEPFTHFLANGSSIVVDGVTFTLTSDDVGEITGQWTLTFTSPSPTTIVKDLALGLKAADSFAFYLFDNESFTTDGSGPGTFTITFLNPGDQIGELSHIDVLFRDGTPTTGVPEPATMVLLGAGLLTATLVARRRAD